MQAPSVNVGELPIRPACPLGASDPTTAQAPAGRGSRGIHRPRHRRLVTLHVWLWYPNPAGLYNGTNPYIRPFNGGS